MIMSIIVALAGIHLAIMLLAACYRVIDLWYRIGDFITGILARILLLAAIDGAIIFLLPGELRTVFIGAQLGYLLFHVALYWLLRFAIMLFESRPR